MKVYSQNQAIISRLLAKAGIDEDVKSVIPIDQAGLTNLMSLVMLEDGSKYVLREYRWPHKTADMNRPQKEIFLHHTLKKQGVPVPDILAAIQDSDREALLMEYLHGELLGDVVGSLSDEDCMQAWYSSGMALRQAHAITYPVGISGIIVGQTVSPFEAGSWGNFHLYSIITHAQRLLERKQDIKVDLSEMRQILERAVPILNNAPSTLLHNDSHPWNVLVRPTQHGWICSGWLDWEYAWVGDPTWDLVRMDLFRVKPIGLTPQAFYEGYGAYPSEPNRSIYEMSIYLWMANQYLDGDRALMPTYEAAMSYLDRIDISIQSIRQVRRLG